jgi:hypothetical protein
LHSSRGPTAGGRLLVSDGTTELMSTVASPARGTAVRARHGEPSRVLYWGWIYFGLDPVLGPSGAVGVCGSRRGVLHIWAWWGPVGVPSTKTGNDANHRGCTRTKTLYSRPGAAHRCRSHNLSQQSCQGGGRGFESRRPLQRNRRSGRVRSGLSCLDRRKWQGSHRGPSRTRFRHGSLSSADPPVPRAERT